MKDVDFIEDCLWILADLHPKYSIAIEEVDKTLLYSIGRQTHRGLALTDRQYDLAKQKIEYYRPAFESLNIDINSCKDNLRQPLREIDRSQYIRIVEHNNEEKLVIRFPFNKPKIMILQNKVKSQIPNDEYYHDKGSQAHYFTFNEINLYLLVTAFKDKKFEVDKEVLNIYNELEEMNNNKHKYVSGVYNFELCNLRNKAIETVISDVGEPPCQENLALYKDRRYTYGLDYFDEEELERSLRELTILSQKIINRESIRIFISNKKYSIESLVNCLWELNRFPLLVVIDHEFSLEHLHEFHRAVSGFVLDEEQTVMYRLDNNTNSEFNEYIKNNNLNNPLDKNTKIVYISSNKIPKPLIKSDWRYKAILNIGFIQSWRRNTIADDNDLIMYYDDVASPTMSNFLNIQEI